MELRLNIHKIENNDIQLGDLVTLKSNPFIFKYDDKYSPLKESAFTQLFKNVDYIPIMSVIEATQDFDKISNKSIKKYKCQFFIPKKGLFGENWFYENQISPLKDILVSFQKQIIEKIKGAERFTSKWFELSNQGDMIEKTLQKKEKSYLETGTSVVFKTALLESYIFSEPIKGQIISPFMTVKEIAMEKNEKLNIYDNQSQKIIREVSLYKIKCMWYNPIDSKFSEDWFIPEALIEVK